ncbi:DUF2634 domain-containing protein [Lacticaseibacillus pabuli]|uniref:DUF2634 domain-containing protein n=1 Tax=Lacticaseibacillus pabuli TaxID=3025672 RepID=A0ABY7WU04_9LACO|nr:DUF2634 domain-containing protein [Lacticaseibacillus sp. KACC 23028]WDF83642.1 DUF2634 domain-containing protein [Lacticaseibacillus sp. KACC 23028]
MDDDDEVEVDTPVDAVDEGTEPTRTYAVVDGHIRGMTDGLEAMRQAVGKILHTERFVWPIYDDQYGNDLLELIGKPMPYAENEVRRMTEDALLADDRITGVTFNSVTVVTSDTLAVHITVSTIFGDVPAGMEVTTA